MVGAGGELNIFIDAHSDCYFGLKEPALQNGAHPVDCIEKKEQTVIWCDTITWNDGW